MGAIDFLENQVVRNRTVVRSPYAAAHKLSQDWAENCHGANPHPEGAPAEVKWFEAERGACQGAPPSAIHWVAFFDILTRTFEVLNYKKIQIRTFGWTLGAAQDVAFVDDLQSIAPTAQVLQHKADIVSAFAIIFGMVLSVKKLRYLVAHFGENGTMEDTLTDESIRAPLVVHERGWTPRDISQKRDEPIKYIGVYHNPHPIKGDPNPNFTVLNNLVKASLRIYSAKCASAAIRIATTEKCLLPAAAYKATYSSITNAKLTDLTRRIDGAVRGWLRKRELPTNLLHLKWTHGGVGITSLEDRVNQQKLTTTLGAAQDANIHTQSAAYGIMDRMIRRNTEAIPGYREVLTVTKDIAPNSVSLWFHSVLESLDLNGLALVRGGPPAPPHYQTISNEGQVSPRRATTYKAWAFTLKQTSIGAWKMGHTSRST